MKPQELEDRLINFASVIIGLCEQLPVTRANNHIAGQLLRSGTSPAPNYGEARAAESRKDFVHKLKVALKELRESLVWLKILEKRRILKMQIMEPIMAENNELISILVSSARTLERGKHSQIKNL